MNKDRFYVELNILGIVINDLQKKQLEKYYNFLIEWNEKINLTTIIKEDEVYLKHFYDSLTLSKIIDLNKVDTLCDVGSGAGFPGVVLKIIFPNLNITLLDSLNKRVIYLNKLIEHLELTKIIAVHGRAEEFARTNREKYDVVIARAVAPLQILLEYCIPMTKVHGNFIAMKANISQEIKESEEIAKLLASNIEKQEEFFLPIENSIRTIIKYKKNEITSLKFPRHQNIIKKQHKK